MATKINSFNDLIKYFERPEVTVQDIERITHEGLKVIFIDKYTKEEAIQELKAFWKKYNKPNCDMPLFIMKGSLDVEDK